eukprot:406872_1
MSSSRKGHRRRASKIVFIKHDSTLGALQESSTPISVTFQELTEFVKKAVAKIYELNEITDIVYNCIKETHDGIDDIIDDIDDRHESLLIETISKKIENNESITYEWND